MYIHNAGWASRTYFSDNGSTAIEIALKMAFRKFSSDHGILNDNSTERCTQLVVRIIDPSSDYFGLNGLHISY